MKEKEMVVPLPHRKEKKWQDDEIGELIDYLSDPKTKELIKQDSLTILAIKPRLNVSSTIGKNDFQAAKTVLRIVKRQNTGATIQETIHIQMTRADCEELYAHKVVELIKVNSSDSKYANEWEHLVAYWTSGVSTFVFIQVENASQASLVLRGMGENPDKKRNLRSFKVSQVRNVIHCCDNSDEVESNLEFLKRKLTSMKGQS